MQRVLVLLILLGAVATYLVRCLTHRSYAEILESTANASRQIQQYQQTTGTHAGSVEVTVLALPSGQPLSNAVVECRLYWAGLSPVSANTNAQGTAHLTMKTGQLELGRPVSIKVTDALGRRAF